MTVDELLTLRAEALGWAVNCRNLGWIRAEGYWREVARAAGFLADQRSFPKHIMRELYPGHVMS